jgi:hypothetical protein
LLLEQITGAGQLIAACRCCHHKDTLRHVVVVFGTEYLAWAREYFFGKATARIIPWRTVVKVTDQVSGYTLRHRFALHLVSGAKIEFDGFQGDGVQLGGKPVELDLASVRALVRRLVAAAGGGQGGTP